MKWLHNLLKGVSLTAALFVFQACYGSPPLPDDYFETAEQPAAVDVAAENPVVDAVPAEMPETDVPETETGE